MGLNGTAWWWLLHHTAASTPLSSCHSNQATPASPWDWSPPVFSLLQFPKAGQDQHQRRVCWKDDLQISNLVQSCLCWVRGEVLWTTSLEDSAAAVQSYQHDMGGVALKCQEVLLSPLLTEYSKQEPSSRTCTSKLFPHIGEKTLRSAVAAFYTGMLNWTSLFRISPPPQ